MSVEAKPSGISPKIWCVAFVVAFLAMAAAMYTLRPPMFVQLPLMLLPMLLMIPYIKSYERKAEADGYMSGALARYNRRFGWATVSYVVAIFTAIYLHKNMQALGPLAIPIALLPALSVLLMIWAMARYIIEEDDEYLRQRQMIAGLIATGLLLAVATSWGFVEQFGLAPHVPAWVAFPVWALGLGLGQIILKARSA